MILQYYTVKVFEDDCASFLSCLHLISFPNNDSNQKIIHINDLHHII
jgi:hypothetical protein